MTFFGQAFFVRVRDAGRTARSLGWAPPGWAVLAPVCLALTCITVAPVSQALTDAEKAGARAAAERGGLAYQDGRYADAVDYFTRAEEIVHATPHLLYIARANAKLGRLIAAREAYLKITQEEISSKGPKIFGETKAQAEAELAELEPRIPYVSVAVEGAPADEVEVLRDGVVLPSVLVGIPQPVDPGQHTFVAKSKHRKSVEQTVSVREGAQETVVLKLEGKEVATATGAQSGDSAAKDEGGGKSGLVIAGYTALGIGVVGGVLGTVFLVQSNDSYRAADAVYDMCQMGNNGATCSPSQTDEIERLDSDGLTQTIIGTTALAVGGAAAVTGVVLLVVGGKAKKKEAVVGTYVRPVVGFGTIGLRGAF